MKARVHTPRAMERLTHPVKPSEVHEVVSALIWDGDKVTAYWLAEEMLMHPRARFSLTVNDSYESHGFWLGLWSVLGDCMTKKQRESKPESALDRDRAERERRRSEELRAV